MPRNSPLRLEELREVDRLPSPTGVALAILRMVESERVTAADVARALASDPALAGRVLRVVNSATTGAPRRIGAVKDGVRLLGLRAVRNIALGFSLLSEAGSG